MIRSALSALLCFVCLAQNAVAGTYEDAVAATIENRPEVLSAALSAGLDPNTVTPSGTADPLLMLAVRNNADKIVDLLLEQKQLRIDTPNQISETPLMLAVYLKQNAVADKLLAHGASVNNRNRWTPLHYAAAVSNHEMVVKLLEHGADVNARTVRGITPLYMAARDGDYETVRLLLKAGARKDFCTNDAYAPYDIAKQRRNTDSVINALKYDHCR